MTTSKSPRRVLQVAYESARGALPAYGHKFSPHKFTQPQLLACLVGVVAGGRRSREAVFGRLER